jgi:hypothetical protein
MLTLLCLFQLQVQQMSEYKQQWQTKQDDLNHQFNQTQRREQDLKERLDSELIVASQLAENAMLDKQLAEEQVGDLAQHAAMAHAHACAVPDVARS